MNTLYILYGPAACGKTTFARKLSTLYYTHIANTDYDQLRQLLNTQDVLLECDIEDAVYIHRLPLDSAKIFIRMGLIPK